MTQPMRRRRVVLALISIGTTRPSPVTSLNQRFGQLFEVRAGGLRREIRCARVLLQQQLVLTTVEF